MTALPISCGEKLIKGSTVLNPGLLWNLENKASNKKEIIARPILHKKESKFCFLKPLKVQSNSN